MSILSNTVRSQNLTSPTYFCSFPNTYPYRGLVYQTLDFFFLIHLDHKPAIRAGDDVADYVWMRRADLSLEDIAFASGRQALFEYSRLPAPLGMRPEDVQAKA